VSVSVRLEACARSFADGTRALHPTDLAIAPGETLALLGPSGCGKTTTLRLIAGLAEPDPGGRVLFDGRDVTRIPIERRNVGMVFQSYALFPNMDVAANVGYGLRVRRLPREEIARRVIRLLEMMRIGELAHRRIDQLSGGQRQRVALARALAPEPAVLLLDEPLAALDARLRDELRAEIAALLRSLSITAVFVTHAQAEAMGLGDRVAVMRAGRIAQIGTPEEVYRRPANRFVAGFVGTLNVLGGRVAAGRVALPGGWLAAALPEGTSDLCCRPEALRLDPAGSLAGTVTAAFFQGDRTRLTVTGAAEGPIVLDAPWPAPRVGERVRLSADPEGIVSLPETGA
jgi:putative spermidine/putrescine transport system ATP-binding protein